MGLAMSLHCIGMCGPLVIGFSKVFNETKLTLKGQELNTEKRKSNLSSKLGLDFLWYHLGRLWTYSMLGIMAGFIGGSLKAGGDIYHNHAWQKSISVGMSAFVILSGLLLLGLIPGIKLDQWLNGCGSKKLQRFTWFGKLLKQRGITARLLLGVIMGFLPCGLVYGMLVAVATIGGPIEGGIGMFAFGLGTLPGLTGVLIASGLLPVTWRERGGKLAAVVMIGMGVWLGIQAINTANDAAVDCGCHQVE